MTKKEMLEKTISTHTLEIENCRIKSTALGLENHNVMSMDLNLEGNGWGVSFGGFRIDGEYGMECLKELLNTLEVGKYEDLKGMYVRALNEGLGGRCLAVGHLMKDKWFSFKEFYDRMKRERIQ